MKKTPMDPDSENSSDTVVITVVGKDKVGIIAAVSAMLAKEGMNIMDISQTILQNIFTMIMLVSLPKEKCDFADLKVKFDTLGRELGVSIILQHSDIFNAMHRI
ncbi:MAG: ACT domain-containing protein [Saccharofermentanales bacterium]